MLEATTGIEPVCTDLQSRPFCSENNPVAQKEYQDKPETAGEHDTPFQTANPAFSFDDLRLDDFLALKPAGFFTIRSNVLFIHRRGEPDTTFRCRSPGMANQLRLRFADGLAGHVEGAA